MVPHRDGGSREPCNLVYPCRRHHKLIDHGLMSVGGPADDPVFRDADGNLLGENLTRANLTLEDAIRKKEARAPPDTS